MLTIHIFFPVSIMSKIQKKYGTWTLPSRGIFQFLQEKTAAVMEDIKSHVPSIKNFLFDPPTTFIDNIKF